MPRSSTSTASLPRDQHGSPPTAAREGSARGEAQKLKGIAVSNQTDEYNALAIGAKQVGRQQLER